MSRSLRLLALLLTCLVPLAWAASIGNLSVSVVPQLRFATPLVERSAAAGPFTQAAISGYSPGAISYHLKDPAMAAVASVNATTGEVTPLAVGEARIVAMQQASAPFPAASAEYALRLSGSAATFQPWVLPTLTYGATASYVIGTGPSDLPPAQSNSNGAISYRLKDPAMATVATVSTQNNTTTVNILRAGDIVLVAEQAATTQYAAGSTEATLRIQTLTTTLSPVSLTYGGPSQVLSAQVAGISGDVSYRTADSTVATVSNGRTVSAVGVGSTPLYAVQNGIDVAAGTLTAAKGTPTLTGLTSLDRTVSDKPFELNAQSLDLVTGAARTAPVSYAVTAADNANAVRLYNDQGRTMVWIAQAGTVDITATQAADDRHEAVQASMTLRIGAGLPWVDIRQALPAQVLRGEPYTVRVLTNAPERLQLGMRSGAGFLEYLNGSHWEEDVSGGAATRGPNIEDVYALRFNNTTGSAIRALPVLYAPQYWDYPGFPNYIDEDTNWPLPETLLSPNFASNPDTDVAFPRGPYTFTFGTVPAPADAAIPAQVAVDGTSVNSAVASLVRDNPGAPDSPYHLVPVGVGSYTLRGWIGGYPTSTTVTVLPQATVLTDLQPIALSTDSKRVEITPPLTSRPGTPSFSYQITGDTGIATLESETGPDGVTRHHVRPVAVGNTILTVVQAAAGNYAAGSIQAAIAVSAGAPPITGFPASIVRTFNHADILLDLPGNIDPALGGINLSLNITVPNGDGKPVATATLTPDNQIRIAFTGAGVTELTVSQGAAQASTTITVNKAEPNLSYTLQAPTQLQQPVCRGLAPSPVLMPRLNEGLRAPIGGVAVISNARLRSLSNGAITYTIGDPDRLSFGSPTYDQGSLYGAFQGNNAGSPGVSYTLTVQQAESADYLPASITVPGAILINGYGPDYVPAGCPA